jgi:DNA-directed RNA polymerase beta subunit
MIHKLLSVEFKIIPSTDRDSLKGKRINAAGRSYAKSFKRDFNTVIVQPIKKRLTNEFIKTPFMSVQMAHAFKSAVTPVDLEKSMNQSIKTANK